MLYLHSLLFYYSSFLSRVLGSWSTSFSFSLKNFIWHFLQEVLVVINSAISVSLSLRIICGQGAIWKSPWSSLGRWVGFNQAGNWAEALRWENKGGTWMWETTVLLKPGRLFSSGAKMWEDTAKWWVWKTNSKTDYKVSVIAKLQVWIILEGNRESFIKQNSTHHMKVKTGERGGKWLPVPFVYSR